MGAGRAVVLASETGTIFDWLDELLVVLAVVALCVAVVAGLLLLGAVTVLRKHLDRRRRPDAQRS